MVTPRRPPPGAEDKLWEIRSVTDAALLLSNLGADDFLATLLSRVREILDADTAAVLLTWTFSMSAFCVIQDHPAHIPRGPERPRCEGQPQAHLFCAVYLLVAARRVVASEAEVADRVPAPGGRLRFGVRQLGNAGRGRRIGAASAACHGSRWTCGSCPAGSAGARLRDASPPPPGGSPCADCLPARLSSHAWNSKNQPVGTAMPQTQNEHDD